MSLRREVMEPHLKATGAPISEAQHRERLMNRYDCAQVLLDGERPVGLLKVARDPGEWRVIQIQLLPELQGQGIGKRLLGEIVAEARAARVSLVLRVLKANPARRLYERLGFRTEREDEFEFHMRLQVP